MIHTGRITFFAGVAVVASFAAARAGPSVVDRQAPIIAMLPSTQVSVTHPLIVRAHIEDESGVGAATLWAQGDGETAYRPFAMELGEQGDFVCTLPVWPSRGRQVTYYVEAIDLRGNGPRRSGSPRTPFVAVFKGAVKAERAQAAAHEPQGWGAKAVLLLAPVLGLLAWWKLGRPARKRGRPPAVAQTPGLPSIPQASLNALWSGQNRGAAGTSLVEALAVLAVLAVLLGMAAVSLDPLETPVRRGSDLLMGALRQARATAMATTTAHRLRPLTNRLLIVEHAPSCSSGAWTEDPKLDIELPDQVTLDDAGWTVCFDTRGTASANLLLTLEHPRYESEIVEVLMGGAVRPVS